MSRTLPSRTFQSDENEQATGDTSPTDPFGTLASVAFRAPCTDVYFYTQPSQHYDTEHSGFTDFYAKITSAGATIRITARCSPLDTGALATREAALEIDLSTQITSAALGRAFTLARRADLFRAPTQPCVAESALRRRDTTVPKPTRDRVQHPLIAAVCQGSGLGTIR
jgi:hypothetical protein